MGGITWLNNLLGTVVSGLTMISIGARLFAVPLTSVFSDVLDAYRRMMDAIFAPLEGLISAIIPGFEIPSVVHDIFALSFIGGAAMARALYQRKAKLGKAKLSTFLVFTFVAGITLGGLVAYFFLLTAWIFPARDLLNGRKITRGDFLAVDFALSTLTALIGALIFFALNAFATGLS